VKKKAHPKPAPPQRRSPGYWLHAALLLILAIECAVAIAGRRSRAGLERDLQSGTPAAKAYALFVLTNRDTPRPPDAQFVSDLLDSGDPLLREWTMTTNFTRLTGSTMQRTYLDSLGDSPQGLRCRFLLTRGIGQTPWMTLPELAEFLDALEE